MHLQIDTLSKRKKDEKTNSIFEFFLKRSTKTPHFFNLSTYHENLINKNFFI